MFDQINTSFSNEMLYKMRLEMRNFYQFLLLVVDYLVFLKPCFNMSFQFLRNVQFPTLIQLFYSV